LSGSSNGQTKPFQAAKPFKGVPVTVRIPTHVDIAVRESLFYNMPEMTPVCLSARNLQLTANYVYSDKIISVDPKRPFAGTLDYNMGFQTTHPIERDRQFFSSFDYNVKDETIKTIDNILKNVVPTLGLNKKMKSTSAMDGAEGSAPSSLKEIERVVAWKRFDISDQNLEAEIASFVAHHMNNCHSCQGQPCASDQIVGVPMEMPQLEMQ